MKNNNYKNENNQNENKINENNESIENMFNMMAVRFQAVCNSVRNF